MHPMQIARQSWYNTIGWLVKLTILPAFLHFFGDTFSVASSILILPVIPWTIIIMGLLGIIYSDLLMLRFGDGNLQPLSAASRQVDVGLYARNRHPSFWFYSVYQLGVLLLFCGITLFSVLAWLVINLFGLTFLLLVQEKNLIRSLDQKYIKYREDTPFAYWRRSISEDQTVKLLPLLVWLFGMVVLRNWYKIDVRGREHIPHERPFILVANHENYLDPFLFAIFLPFELQFVTTADVFTTPLMRFMLKGIGTFPMRRHRQDLKSIRTMIRMIKRGQVVGIFPEGGRSIDGSPLPILKETLKLIQHSKVPILPVHLEGAYEIWPRWAPNRRRGQVTATFKPVIPVTDQTVLSDLETLIQTAIFTPSKSFRQVKTHNIARGLDNFLWACSACQAHNSIEVTSGNQIKCIKCGSQWQVAADYTLIKHGSDTTLTLPSWIDTINTNALEHWLDPGKCPGLEPDERAYLHSVLVRYSNEAGLELTTDLSLTLTNQRIFLMQQTDLIESWTMDSITIFTMDYHNAVSIGVRGIRHSFFLPKAEIILKWQTYFDRVKSLLSQI